MGIEVQKNAFPTLFNFAKVRAASQPHVLLTFTAMANKAHNLIT